MLNIFTNVKTDLFFNCKGKFDFPDTNEKITARINFVVSEFHLLIYERKESAHRYSILINVLRCFGTFYFRTLILLSQVYSKGFINV